MPLAVPPPLSPGSRVAVVAPSGPLDPVRLERGVGTLESWGLDIMVMPHAMGTANSGMFAGTDEERAEDFIEAMCLPGVSAVLCARGGHGATRIIDVLDWDRMSLSTPRWLVGSSDITALHESVHGRLGLATLHGAMIASAVFAGEAPDFDTVQSLQRALFSPVSGMVIEADSRSIFGEGEATGRLMGGNLTLLCSTLGTADSLGARDCIVLLEDVAEPPYRIDRMLTQLIRTNWFEGVRGVALGTFHQCGDVMPALEERLGSLGVPVLGGFSVGHGPRQLSLPLGMAATLTTESGLLSVA